jgi:hypothetical protein
LGYTLGEINKKPANKYISIQWGMKTQKAINFGGELSFVLSFMSASTAVTYIFTALYCTTVIISLEPCALNAELQHFMLRCSTSYWDLIE